MESNADFASTEIAFEEEREGAMHGGEGDPALFAVAEETTPSLPVMLQAHAPMFLMTEESMSPSSAVEPMASMVIEEPIVSTFTMDPTKLTPSIETEEPMSSVLMAEAAPCAANPSTQLGTVFVNGLRQSARLRRKGAVNHSRC